MKKVSSFILTFVAVFGLFGTVAHASVDALTNYTYDDTVFGWYTDVNTDDNMKETPTTEKAIVCTNKKRGYNYWFRVVNSEGAERGFAFLTDGDVNREIPLTNSNTVYSFYYYAQARREYPAEFGTVSGYYRP